MVGLRKNSALREGWVIFLVLFILWGGLLFYFPWASLLAIVAFAFTIYFFRDPERLAPGDATLAVAAADGRIVAVEEMEEPEVLKMRMKRVSIFLSVLDVHVNRAPVGGRITASEERKGSYLDARDPRSSEKNAARLWVIEGDLATVAVRQITGAIARRIVPWSRVGDTLRRGEKFGMIRFGSRTEIYLPMDAEILVKEGDKVKAGETPVARLKGNTR